MLKDQLYKVTSIVSEEGNIKATLSIDSTHPLFKGHFPDQPVLPGACQLQMVREVLENALETQLKLIKADNLKFMSLVDPEKIDLLNLNITYKQDDQNLKVSAIMMTDGTTICFKFQGLMGSKHG
jgi:3-hydroxyacyl-[acyl-carrier-protein] dehydratase